MKVGILADSHDHLHALRAAARTMLTAGVEHIIWAGDFVAPFALPPIQSVRVPVTGVLGNNDGERLFLARRFAEFGWELQPKFAFPTLGTVRFAVHHEQEPVDALAHSGLYDVVVYGHTHELDVRRVGDALVINPGETCGWLTGSATCVVLELESLEPTVVNLKF
ncbi:MAG: metallophosphoesterase [Armatimonadetes bacterium]|nr:metallophosphoesterase [Armatimonadota bacterium]